MVRPLQVIRGPIHILQAPLCRVHADTCIAGPNCIVLEYTDQGVNVSAYSEPLDTMENIPIVTATTALDDVMTGTTTILI